jgi:hypothetical protein
VIGVAVSFITGVMGGEKVVIRSGTGTHFKTSIVLGWIPSARPAVVGSCLESTTKTLCPPNLARAVQSIRPVYHMIIITGWNELVVEWRKQTEWDLPAGPAPMTTTSYSFLLIVSLWGG